LYFTSILRFQRGPWLKGWECRCLLGVDIYLSGKRILKVIVDLIGGFYVDKWGGLLDVDTGRMGIFFPVKSVYKVVGSLVEVGDSWGSMEKSVFRYLWKSSAPSKWWLWEISFLRTPPFLVFFVTIMSWRRQHTCSYIVGWWFQCGIR